jgi:hypothetical protein
VIRIRTVTSSHADLCMLRIQESCHNERNCFSQLTTSAFTRQADATCFPILCVRVTTGSASTDAIFLPMPRWQGYPNGGRE